MAEQIVHKSCITCNERPDHPLLFVVKPTYSFQVAQCPSCGLIYSDVNLRPDRVLEENGAYFAYEVYTDEVQLYRQESERYLNAVHRFKRTGRLLDIGCGLGYFMAVAREQGWQVAGIDISPLAIRTAQQRFGLEDIQAITVAEANIAPESFDVITLWNCLEHMADPAASLNKILPWLKPGGFLAIEVPDHDGIIYSINLAMHQLTRGQGAISNYLYSGGEGGHVYIFTARSLERLLSSWQFEACYLERNNSPAKALLSKYSFNKGFLKAFASYAALYLGYGLAKLTHRENRLLMIFCRQEKNL